MIKYMFTLQYSLWDLAWAAWIPVSAQYYQSPWIAALLFPAFVFGRAVANAR